MALAKKIIDKLKPARARAAKAAPPKNEAAARRLREVCADAVSEALGRLGSRPAGLTAAEVEDGLKEHGRNILARTRKHRALADILERLANPLVVQLLVIGVVSFVMGDLRSTPWSAAWCSSASSSPTSRRSARAGPPRSSSAWSGPTPYVLREGKEIEIPLAGIVPGDIVVLDAGSLVPADLRLIAKDFFVSQSALTGESMPVEKAPAPASARDAGDPLELPNAVLPGQHRPRGAAGRRGEHRPAHVLRRHLGPA